MNDDLKRVNLRDIVDRISENTIVLPDFQRGFTWKENNRQKALLASVLTKLPIDRNGFIFKCKNRRLWIQENRKE